MQLRTKFQCKYIWIFWENPSYGNDITCRFLEIRKLIRNVIAYCGKRHICAKMKLASWDSYTLLVYCKKGPISKSKVPRCGISSGLIIKNSRFLVTGVSGKFFFDCYVKILLLLTTMPFFMKIGQVMEEILIYPVWAQLIN